MTGLSSRCLECRPAGRRPIHQTGGAPQLRLVDRYVPDTADTATLANNVCNKLQATSGILGYRKPVYAVTRENSLIHVQSSMFKQVRSCSGCREGLPTRRKSDTTRLCLSILKRLFD